MLTVIYEFVRSIHTSRLRVTNLVSMSGHSRNEGLRRPRRAHLGWSREYPGCRDFHFSASVV